MPEFIPVLIAAVLVFAGLLVAFGAIAIIPPSHTTGGGGAVTQDLIHIPIADNFSIGYISAEMPVANISGTVSRGLLSAEDKIYSFQLSEPESATGGHIVLHVNDTNRFGKLIVSLNGNELFNDYAYPGDHSLAFGPELLKAENSLEVKAESSGWKFWAPTVYVLSAEASVNWAGALTKNFSFSMSNREVALSTKGRLVISVNRKEGTGQLVAKLNGQQIYADVKTDILGDFSSDNFLIGTNRLDLSVMPGTRYAISHVEIIAYFE